MDIVEIAVKIGEHEIYRRFQLVDGQVVGDMQENIDDMVDTILKIEEF